MFGFFKSPGKQKSVDPSDPSDHDTGANIKEGLNPGRRTSSEPILIPPDSSIDPSYDSNDLDRYKNNFRDSGGLQSQTTDDLENYMVYKSKETTKSVDNCLRIAEDIRSDGTRTLDMLHQQGEQINRTHVMAADMDKDLRKGEKLLNNLGGMFSKPWKPKKTRDITGPLITSDTPAKKSANHKAQREKLGLAPLAPKGNSRSQTPHTEPTNAMQKVEHEKTKQDDALSDLSNILGDLKGMAVDMGTELDRHDKALDHLSDDVEELNSRVKGANQRARRLLS